MARQLQNHTIPPPQTTTLVIQPPGFTDDGAWELIASKLESGHRVETVELKKPKGKTGYVMKIRLESSTPPLYVKLELHRGWILGRSFHYSER